MKISKIRYVKTPTRAHDSDAGIDFYMPKLTRAFIKILKSKNSKCNFYSSFDKLRCIVLSPHENILIPSGIHLNIPSGWALIFFNKSGIASKKGLVVGAEVIDSDYTGEVHINLINTSNTTQIIEEDRKIIQGIMLQVGHDIIEEVPLGELYEEETERGEGGFGHTDE